MTALPFAIEMASRYRAKLVVVHISPGASDQRSSVASTAHTSERIHQMLGDAGGRPYEVVIEHGNVLDRLPAIAGRSNADLLVLGNHGSHGLEKLVRGSVTQEIMCSARIPVLAVGAHVTRPSVFRKILYATDFSVASEAAFVCAVSIAARFAASLVFLHVNEWNSREPPIQAQAKTYEFFERHIAEAGVYAIDLHRDVLVKFGARADQILDVAAAGLIDLIVMGLRCKHGLAARVSSHLPGPVSYEVMSQAPCAVLGVPASDG
jgi:nucleotide-binding universal stress UspA family protein